MSNLRRELVKAALKWQKKYGVGPSITSSLSEYDAAKIVGMTDKEYSAFMITPNSEGRRRSGVSRGYDFEFKGKKYQIKGSRPSGLNGSKVTWVRKAANYNWDILIWILYNTQYDVLEVWKWDVENYKKKFRNKERLSPDDYRQGKKLKHL